MIFGSNSFFYIKLTLGWECILALGLLFYIIAFHGNLERVAYATFLLYAISAL